MSMTATRDGRRPLTGRQVLFGLIAFFGVVMGVNVIFIVTAIDSFPGEDVRRSWFQGIHYNDVLAERAAQDALGWEAVLGVGGAGAGSYAELRMTADGAPLGDLEIIAELRHPTDATLDRTLAFERIALGVWRAPLGDVALGRWDIAFTARDLSGNTFEGKRRIWLR